MLGQKSEAEMPDMADSSVVSLFLYSPAKGVQVVSRVHDFCPVEKVAVRPGSVSLVAAVVQMIQGVKPAFMLANGDCYPAGGTALGNNPGNFRNI